MKPTSDLAAPEVPRVVACLAVLGCLAAPECPVALACLAAPACLVDPVAPECVAGVVGEARTLLTPLDLKCFSNGGLAARLAAQPVAMPQAVAQPVAMPRGCQVAVPGGRQVDPVCPVVQECQGVRECPAEAQEWEVGQTIRMPRITKLNNREKI